MVRAIEAAERKSRARAIIFLFMAAALVVATWFNSGPVSERPIRLMPWLVMVALAALNLTPLATRRARAPLAALLNDESTQVHRTQSFVAGFWASLAAAGCVALVATAAPVTAILAAKVVIAAALAAALISFAVQELRAAQ
jgi:hypothetical protein